VLQHGFRSDHPYNRGISLPVRAARSAPRCPRIM
jgi:hypothetical protein